MRLILCEPCQHRMNGDAKEPAKKDKCQACGRVVLCRACEVDVVANRKGGK